ncbi:MAG: acyltransferase family protein [Novosphingobium sp.]
MQYRREIDGLRAVAVVPVILFHAGLTVFSGGFVGVDVFFVISGFLITGILIAELERGDFSIARFYERRARRILPALYVVLACCLPFAWLWMPPALLKSFAASLVAVIGFASNILFWRQEGYFAASAELKPLLHTWSLAVEEQYYLFFPIGLWAFWRFGRARVFVGVVLLALISLGVSEWASRHAPSANFYLATSRAWELLAGSICAFLSRGNQPRPNDVLSLAGLGMVMLAIFAFDDSTPFPGLYALVPVVGTCLIILYGGSGSMVSRLLGAAPFVGIGLISYSAYLWHQPLFAFARLRSLSTPSQGLMLGLAALSLVLAWASWRYIERPFRRAGAGLLASRRQVFVAGAAVGAVFVGIGLAGYLANGVPSRMDARVLAIQSVNASVLESQVWPCWDKLRANATIGDTCRLGDPAKAPSFAIVGDSHAGALLHQLDGAARRAGLGGANYTYKTCPPLEGVEPAQVLTGGDVCSSLRRSFFAALRVPGAMPDTLVVNARWTMLMERSRFDNGEGGIEEGVDWVWNLGAPSHPSAAPYKQRMAAEIARSIRLMLDAGKRVVLVYPVPEMGWSVPDQIAKSYMATRTLRPADASVSQARFLMRNRDAIAALDAIGEHPGLIRIRPDALLCNTFLPGRCAAMAGGQPLYVDSDHLSDTGSAMVVGQVMAAVNAPPAPARFRALPPLRPAPETSPR